MADVSFAGSGQGTASGSGSLSRTSDLGGSGQGQATGVGVLVRETSFAGANTEPLNAWAYRQKVTIQASEVPTSLSDFPVYLDLSTMSEGFFDHVQSDGSDIRVTDTNGNLVPREVVTVDTNNQTGEVHFLASSLSASSDTEFYVYYGSPNASAPAVTDPNGRNAVWSTYGFVSHNGADDESTGNFGSPSNLTVTPGDITGQIESGTDYDGGEAQYDDNSVVDFGTGDFHVSAWTRLGNGQSGGGVASKYSGDGSPGFVLKESGGYGLLTADGSSGYEQTFGAAQDDGQFHHLVSVREGAGRKRQYIDGAEDLNYTLTTREVSNGRPLHLGYFDHFDIDFPGDIDEIRLAAFAPSADRVSAEYTNQSAPTTFYAVGAEESSGNATASGTGKLSRITTFTQRILKLENWDYRQVVTIPASNLPTGLSDFPVYLDLSQMSDGFFNNVQSDGADIRVADESGSFIPREVVSVDPNNKTGQVHFLAPSLSASADNKFYVYYGNAGVSAPDPTDPNGRNAVWANYGFVSHNGADPEATGNFGSPSNLTVTPGDITGQIEAGTDYNGGEAQYADNSAVDFGTGDFHVSAWTRLESGQSGGGVASKYSGDGSPGFVLKESGGYGLLTADGSSGYEQTFGAAQDDGQFHHLVSVREGAGRKRQYIDGAEDLNYTLTRREVSNGRPLHLGYFDHFDIDFPGDIDEIRLAAFAPSADRVSVEYANQSDPASFYSISSQQDFATARALGTGSLSRQRAFEGSGTGLATGTSTLALTRSFSGAGTGVANGAGDLRRIRVFAGSGSGLASGSGTLLRVRSLAGAGQGIASGIGGFSLVRRFSGAGEGVAIGAGQIYFYFSGHGVGRAIGQGLFGAANVSGDPVPVGLFSGADDERIVLQITDTGTLNVTFNVLEVDGTENVPQPSWVKFGYTRRRLNQNEIDIILRANIDISEALFVAENSQMIWEAVIDNGQDVKTVEYKTLLFDRRVPTERLTVVYYDNNNSDVVKRSEIGAGPEKKLFGFERPNGTYTNLLHYDAVNRRFITIEDSDNFDDGLRARGVTGNYFGEYGENLGDAVGLDQARELFWHAERQVDVNVDQLRKFHLEGGKIEDVAQRVIGNGVRDLCVDESYRWVFLGGDQIFAQGFGIVRVEYPDPHMTGKKATVPDSETGRVLSLHLDEFNRVLVSVEQDGQKLVTRDPKDLTKKNEHDFGNNQDFYGIHVDEANREIFFARAGFDGIQSTPYSLDGSFTTEVSGSYRYPVVIGDSKSGIPSQLQIIETRVNDIDLEVEVEVEVLDLSAFVEYELLEAPVSGGNFGSVTSLGRSAGERVTLTHANLSSGTTHYYRARTLTDDDEQEDITPERFGYPFEDAVTKGMTQDADWHDPSVDYTDLSPSTQASVRCVVDLSSNDKGVIMEAGAGGDGLALWTDGSTLYFACGEGTGTSSDSDTAWIEAPMPTGNSVVIEWSADEATDTAALYVNGSLVGTDSFTASNLAGSNEGGIADTHGGLRDTNLSGTEEPFDGTVRSCRVFVGEVTADVS